MFHNLQRSQSSRELMGKKTADFLTITSIFSLFQRAYYSHIYWAPVVCPELCLGYKNERDLILILKELNRPVRTKKIHFGKQILCKNDLHLGISPMVYKSPNLQKGCIPTVHFEDNYELRFLGNSSPHPFSI